MDIYSELCYDLIVMKIKMFMLENPPQAILALNVGCTHQSQARWDYPPLWLKDRPFCWLLQRLASNGSREAYPGHRGVLCHPTQWPQVPAASQSLVSTSNCCHKQEITAYSFTESFISLNKMSLFVFKLGAILWPLLSHFVCSLFIWPFIETHRENALMLPYICCCTSWPCVIGKVLFNV